MTTFDIALERTLGVEGGLSDDPLDRGGRTNYGITQPSYDAWRIATGQPRQQVDLITDAEVRAIYLADYWMPCRCDEMPAALATVVFDMAVNSGVWNAKLALQRALGVKTDGIVGSATLSAIATVPDIVLRFLKQRAGLVAEIVIDRPSQSAFLHGWINRLLDQAWKGVSNG